MFPPVFNSLGKDARDILSKRYYIGMINLKSNTSGDDKINISGSISQKLKAKQMSARFEAKQNLQDYGIAWKADCQSYEFYKAEVHTEHKLLSGLKQDFILQRDPTTGVLGALMKNKYHFGTGNAGLDVVFRSPVSSVSPSFVISHLGYVAGLDLKLGCVNGVTELQRTNFAVGYEVQDFALYGLVSRFGDQFSANVSQHLTDFLTLAGSISWSRATHRAEWSVGGQYTLNANHKHCIKAKLDHLSRFSVSFTTFLSKGLQFTLCGMFNGPDLPQLGLSVKLNL